MVLLESLHWGNTIFVLRPAGRSTFPNAFAKLNLNGSSFNCADFTRSLNSTIDLMPLTLVPYVLPVPSKCDFEDRCLWHARGAMPTRLDDGS
jgi:hypothetical protein